MSATIDIPTGVLEVPEIAGYRDQWAAAPADVAARCGIVHGEAGGASCVAIRALPGSRLATHALGLPDDAGDDELAEIEAFFAAAGVPTLVAVPEGAPSEAALRDRGYAREYPWVKFARDTRPPERVGCDLRIGTVGPGAASAMGEVIVAAFDLPAELAPWFAALPGRPGWHCLGAFDGDRLVATGSLFARGEAGWVTWAATDRSARGRRAQQALLAARIDVARTLGLRWLVVETGDIEDGKPDASHRNILRAGFQAVYRRPFWRAP